jgi:hypothetical protein
MIRPVLLLTAATCLAGQAATGAEPTATPGLPFVEAYCASCHDARMKSGGLDLTRFATEGDLLKARRPWLAALLAHIQTKGDAQAAYEDVLWVLINTKAFLFNH